MPDYVMATCVKKIWLNLHRDYAIRKFADKILCLGDRKIIDRLFKLLSQTGRQTQSKALLAWAQQNKNNQSTHYSFPHYHLW